MMRPLFVLLGAVGLMLVWLGLVVYQAGGDMASTVAALGDSAQRVHLPGLAATAYLQASRLEQRALARLDRTSARGKQLIGQIIKLRVAAARVLLDAGYVPAAERIALEGARADFDDVQARAMLLEVRLHGPDPDAARRELMLLVLRHEHPRLLSLLGQAFAVAGRLEDARSFYERAIQRDPSYLPALLGMAQVAAAGYDRNEINRWLDQAARAAETADEKRAIARLRLPQQQVLRRAWSLTCAFAREHGGSALFFAAFLVFLFSPSFAHLVRRPA